jgi:AraC-like DNA-binding protein/mannose-6-phosphate isomerase-like protein (cupin superfamily)
MQPQRVHAPYDRYTVAFVEMGIPFLSEVEWPRPISRFRWHDHREVQVLWVLEGTMKLELGGRRYEAPAGSSYLVPAQTEHRVGQRPEAPRVVFVDLRLSTEPASEMVRFLGGLGSRVLFRGRTEPLRAAAAELHGALGLAEPRRTARVQAVLWDMIEEMTAQGPPEAGNAVADAPDLRLRIADTLMRDRLAEPLDVERLASAAGLSRSQLTRLYRQHWGVGPAERLRHVRIDKARELLANTTLSVKEVAHVCGFACPNHFCRVFLQLSRTTPSTFRQRHGKAGARLMPEHGRRRSH